MINRAKGEKQFQSVKNEAELYFQAVETLPLYEEAMNSFLDQLREENPGKFETVKFKLADIKNPVRFKEKLDGDYNGNADEVLDLVRGTFVCSKPSEIFDLQDALETAMDVKRVKDNFFKPTATALRNFNNNIRMPNGHIVETQVMYSGTWLVKDITHDLMEDAQSIERRNEKTLEDVIARDTLVAQARKVNNSAVAGLKSTTFINPQWTEDEFAKFTDTGKKETAVEDFRKSVDAAANIDAFPAPNQRKLDNEGG